MVFVTVRDSSLSFSSGMFPEVWNPAITGLVVNTVLTVGRDSLGLGIGELGGAASVKMSKMLDVVTNVFYMNKAGQNAWKSYAS